MSDLGLPDAMAESSIQIAISDALFRNKKGVTQMAPEIAARLSIDVYDAIFHESLLWAVEKIVRLKLQK